MTCLSFHKGYTAYRDHDLNRCERNLSDSKDENLVNRAVSRRSVLKWSGALAAAGVVGIGLGIGGDMLLRKTGTVTTTTTKTGTATSTTTAPPTTITSTTTATSSSSAPSSVVQSGRFSHAGLSGPFWVNTQNGVVTSLEEFNSSTHLATFDRAWRKRIYAPDRIQYPMQRVDFSSTNRNPQNRGLSGYVRISWDAATTLVASEIQRAVQTYGNSSIYTMRDTGWNSTGSMYPLDRLLNMYGGYTQPVGFYSNYGLEIGEKYSIGQTSETGAAGITSWQAIIDNTKYIIMWGGDFVSTTDLAAFGTYISDMYMQVKAAGVKFIVVDPFLNDGAIALGAQWIPILPGTDNAMLAAMAYVMINNNTYDADFMQNYSVGFNESNLPSGAPAGSSFVSYIMGVSDGTPKTPEWASAICGVDAQTITNLATLLTTNQPVLIRTGCGPQRGCNGEHFQRMVATVAAMSGNLGIPGGGYGSQPWDPSLQLPSSIPGSTYSNLAVPAPANPIASTSYIPYYRWADAVLSPGTVIQHDCTNVTLPAIKLLYRLAGINFVNQHSNINKSIQAIRAVDFFVVEDPWMIPDAKFADVILPACTTFERNDITAGWNWVVQMQQAIQPLFESMSDYDILSAIAQNLGIGQQFTEGNTELQWVQNMYNSLKTSTSWDAFTAQGYYEYPAAQMTSTTAYTAFKADPKSNPLPTPSGLIEVYSESIAKFYGANYVNVEWPDVPVVPEFVPPFEWKGSSIASQYPLAMITSHNMWRQHSQADNVEWLQQRSKLNGYAPIWINASDASSRGINQGDTVLVNNGRGQLLAAAMITQRIIPGAVRLCQGSWYNSANPSDPQGLDLGGCPNTLTSDQGTSNLAQASTTHTSLVQVALWSGA
jgi:molybdopterin guanine dinucleotide-containing S/N-oxide reductase-like protein